MFFPMRLYQVGDYVLELFDQEWHGYNTSQASKATVFVESMKYAWGETQYRPKPRKIKVDGAVIHRTGKIVDAQINRLNQLSGSYIDIIAYGFQSCCGIYDNGCSCHRRWASDYLAWFHTRGIIDGVNSGKSNGSNIKLSVSMLIDAAWKPLNRFIWEWRRGRYAPSYRQPTPSPLTSAIRPYPSFKNIYKPHFMQWVKRIYDNDLVMYDPDVWAIVHEQNLPNWDIPMGYGHSWSSDYPNMFSPYEDTDIWSSVPTSIYAFRNLPTTGIVGMVVENSFDVWERTTENSFLSLSSLNQNMADKGYSGLLTSDIVYTGDGLFKPGFVVRSGEVLTGVPVPFSYPGFFPGQMKPVSSKVQITAEDETVEYAQFHTYRRM
jgi:hypothetical protein